MLRKLLGLVAAAAMVSAFASNAWAGVFLPLSSDLSVNLGGNPTISLNGTYTEGGWATLTDNGSAHDLAVDAGPPHGC